MSKLRILIAMALTVVLLFGLWMALSWKNHAFTFSRIASGGGSASSPVFAADEWPQWRGPHRDAVSRDEGLLKEWPREGPPLLWQAKGLGSGMAGVSVAEGRILTLGKRGQEVFLIALNAENGEELWSTAIQADGDPNGTPTIHGKQVFAITHNGVIVGADVKSGELAWKKDLVSDFGGSIPQWGYSESPLVDGDAVLCTPGSEQALIVALNKTTGETIWKTAKPETLQGSGHDGAGYSSIVIGNGAGVRQYVQFLGKGVIGVSPTDGTPLWGYNRVANHVANIPTPIVRDDYVFASSGYGGGAALLRLEQSQGAVNVNEEFYEPGNKMQNHHGGMVLVKDHVYLGHGHGQGLPMCVEFETGQIAWGPVRGAGTGSAGITYADGHLYFRYEDGVLALVEANPKEYRLKSKFHVPSNLGNAWPHPVISQGRLYLRDQDHLLCYDLREKS